jgi:glycosyltransferase involved in cell wall biosynthesis
MQIFNDINAVLAHDWLLGYRGGERVFGAISELFPHAPIHTLFYKSGTTSSIIEKDREIYSSSLNNFPNIENIYRKLLPLFPLICESLSPVTFSQNQKADILISSSHAVIKGFGAKLDCPHVCYIHSPMRYLYDQFDIYFGKGSGTPVIQKIIAHMIRPYLQTWDYLSNQSVTTFISNSKFVSQRVEKYYDRKSEVVYPFVDFEDLDLSFEKSLRKEISENKKDDFFVMVTALAPNKRVDLAVKTFSEYFPQKKLKIIGTGQEEKNLKKISGPNIEWCGNLPRKSVIENLILARAFIFPGVEDFGITPLEALACGTSVVAFGAGGVLESLSGDVATFFYEPEVASLKSAIETFESREKNKEFQFETLYKRAHLFNKMRFQEEFSSIVKTVLQSN